jgi:hypothetical protein
MAAIGLLIDPAWKGVSVVFDMLQLVRLQAVSEKLFSVPKSGCLD